MAIDALTSTLGSSSSTRTASNDTAAMQDRFLTLLVAQVNSQDPLNPMDNAQMTTQMAQINTVNGIEQLNSTLTAMAAQFTSMQVLQGASLVGHDVMIAGNKLVPQAGVAMGAIDLDGPADHVRIDILNSSGQTIDSFSRGSLPAGRHEFNWDASQYAGTDLSYQVVATRAGQDITSTALVRNTVTSIGSDKGVMQIQMYGRAPVSYNDIKAIQ